jgi:hypothetical protein
MLRSRNRRREVPLEVHVPDSPISLEDGGDPEQQVMLADSVGLALQVVLRADAGPARRAFVGSVFRVFDKSALQITVRKCLRLFEQVRQHRFDPIRGQVQVERAQQVDAVIAAILMMCDLGLGALASRNAVADGCRVSRLTVAIGTALTAAGNTSCGPELVTAPVGLGCVEPAWH